MLVTPSSIITVLISERFEHHGTSDIDLKSVIFPVPLIVSVSLLIFHVRLGPHVPLSAKIVPTLVTSARKRVKSLVFIVCEFL